jgi:hypothetical protein
MMKILAKLSICLLGLSITACDTGSQSTGSDAQTVARLLPEATVSASKKQQDSVARQVLNLTIDSDLDNQEDGAINFDADERFIDEANPLADQLNHKNANAGVKLSGKLFTDDTKLENREYLDSVNGLQLNIEGSFN